MTVCQYIAFVVLVDISRCGLFIFDLPCVSAVFPRGNASSLILSYYVKAVPWSSYTNHTAAEPPAEQWRRPASTMAKLKRILQNYRGVAPII